MTQQDLTQLVARGALAASLVVLPGCNPAFVGNLFVLGLTLGVFFGTLGLGRVRGTPRMPGEGPADRSDLGERS